MSLARALAYFVREALTSLRRSWKVSLLAVVTIAVSLFLGGAFLLVTGNLKRLVEEWRGDAKLVVYLAAAESAGAGGPAAEPLAKRIAGRPWVIAVERISSTRAEGRFREAFPGLADLLLPGTEGGALPESLEVAYAPERIDGAALERWIESLAAEPGVAMVDDDRRWLRQVERINAVVRGAGLLLGGFLLAAAIFTTGSVIRLTFYLYREEIEVLRLMGATEFMIRGPFVAEGLIQGLLGGALAVAGLFAAYRLILVQDLPTLFGSALLGGFLEPATLTALVLLGGTAGLVGAALSLREGAGR